MKASIRTALAVSLTGLAMTATAAPDFSGVPSGSYQLDPTHAYVTFSYNHLGLSNPQLSFDDFSVDLNLDSEDPTKSMVNVTIQANSIVAGSEIWKEHLSGEDFFNISEYPEITFQSTSVEAGEGDTLIVTGDLQIKDQSAPVELEVTINNAMEHPMNGKPVIGLDATGQTLRSDFGIDKYAPNVSDEVDLMISAEMTKVE